MESPLTRLIHKTPMANLMADPSCESDKRRFIRRGGYKTNGAVELRRVATMASDVFLDVFLM